MATSWKQQALVEAPVETVWEVLGDPTRFPEWNAEVIEVTGVPTMIEKGSTYVQKGRAPLGMKATTTYVIEELDDLREVKLRCTESGYYSHWLLTEARGNTFIDVELGFEPESHGIAAHAVAAAATKRYLRRTLGKTLDGLRRTLQRG
jgi:uncharacterized protein